MILAISCQQAVTSIMFFSLGATYLNLITDSLMKI